MWRLLLAILVNSSCFICLFGQTASTGALSGRILDPSGALIPGARVELTNPRSGESRSGISDGEGNFYFLLLPPGRYDLQTSKADFAPSFSMFSIIRNLPIPTTISTQQRLVSSAALLSIQESDSFL
jgi:Carboxypeptidase regulatory-like domain